MNITIYDVFKLNRILHDIINQQSSYNIQVAFKIHTLIKWLDETEGFVFARLNSLFGNDKIDMENPIYTALLSSQIPFIGTTLTIEELLNTDGSVKVDVNDMGILEKMLSKAES